MATRYSTRSRRASGSAAAEPAVDGLTASGPVSSAGAGYFEHSEFRARLDELREACAVPGRLVLVTGPAGAGKSVVCEALVADIDPPRCAASVGASHDQPYQQVLAAILEAYGFKVEPGTSPQVMAELIAHHAGDAAVPGRQCVVVVDDAHELPLRDLHALLELVDGSALTLVLAGPSNLVPAIERVVEQFSLDFRQVRLTGLSIGEVNAYLEWRQARDEVRAGGGRPGRLTDVQVRELARRSRGLPGRLEQLLVKFQLTGAPEERALGPFGFPVRHLVILAALVLLLIVVYIVGQVAEDATTTAASTQRVESLAMPPLATPAEVPAAAAPAGGRAGEAPARPAESQEEGLVVPARTATPDDDAPPAPRPIISRQTPAAPAAGPEPAPTPPSTPAVTPTATPPGTASRTPVAPVPAPDAPIRAAPARPAPSTTAPVRTAPAAGGASRSASWIMTQPAGSYTVQLVSLSSAERARAYIAQQPDPGSFATYRLMRNGQLFHVVVYGAFPNKAQADQAAARLPRSVGNVQPWVRQFGQVQESVRTTPQQ